MAIYDVNKSISDRALSDMGSALFVKDTDGKYKFALPVTNMPATGSAPEQQEKTVTTDRKKTYIASRQDSPQKEFTFFAHRDNFEIVKDLKKNGGFHDFLQVNPDYTGYKFSGSVSSYQDETSVGSNLTAKMVITVSQSDEDPVMDVTDLIKDTVVIESEVESVVKLDTTEGTYTITVETDPADATIAAESSATGVATVQASEKSVTITGVAEGSTTITITATKLGYSTMKRTVLVIVPAAA